MPDDNTAHKATPSNHRTSVTVALIGACAVILAALIPVFKDPLASLFSAGATTATSITPFELAGVWEGANPDGVVFRFTFTQTCSLGERCGTVELPEVGCTAVPVLAKRAGDRFSFQETDHQNCGPATGYDTLEMLADGTLLFLSNDQPPAIILSRK